MELILEGVGRVCVDEIDLSAQDYQARWQAFQLTADRLKREMER